ncbi:MAG: Metal binding domain of Ada [Neobacillus sp.]|nr:Metal binding domain of Ada [Neobacillus sp.]
MKEMNKVGNINKSSDGRPKTYTLLGADNIPYMSETPGLFGGNRKSKIYGCFDCGAAIRALKIGGYEEYRVFFADEETAILAGYRPCGTCMRKEYAIWKSQRKDR